MNSIETEAEKIAHDVYATIRRQMESAVSALDSRGVKGIDYSIGAIQHVGVLIESCSEDVRKTIGWKDIGRLYSSYASRLLPEISSLRRDFPGI